MYAYIFFLLIALISANAQAACSTPAGTQGQIQWIPASSKVKYCNGTNWKDTSQSTGASCAGTTAGTINYNSGTLRFCNGTDWINMNGALIDSCAGTTAGTYNFDAATGMFRVCNGTSWYDISTAKRIFVSSTTADGALGSLANADTLCQNDAVANGLGGTWLAWLSNSTTNAIDRMAEVGPWYRIDKTTRITYNKTTLASGTLLNSIATYPDGSSAGAAMIWTGTDANGTAYVNNCLDWTVNTGIGRSDPKGRIGVADSATSTWTQDASVGAICSGSALFSRICVEQ